MWNVYEVLFLSVVKLHNARLIIRVVVISLCFMHLMF